MNKKKELLSFLSLIAAAAIIAATVAVFPVFCIAQNIILAKELITSEAVSALTPAKEDITPEKNEITAEKMSVLPGVIQEVTRENVVLPVNAVIITQSKEIITPERRSITDCFIFFPVVDGEVTPEISIRALKPRNNSLFDSLFQSDNGATITADASNKAVLPEGFGKIGLELPLESKIEITGRKGVSLNYGNVIRTNPPVGIPNTGGVSAGGIMSGFSLTQDLQVRLSGTVGKRVTVNVDFDDTKEQQRDITLFYKGEPGELLQQARFGDVMLSLPNTEFTGYSKSIFGGEVELKYKDFTLKAIGAQTKGKTKTVQFTGGYSQQKIDLYDTSFVKQKYYKLQSDVSHLPIIPGSEQIWIDDLNGYNNNYYNTSNYLDRGPDVTKYTQKTVTGKYSIDYLHPGTDYTIDYTTGVVTFIKAIQQNYVIVVAYKYSGGASGYDGTIFDFNDNNYSGNKMFLQTLLGEAAYYDRQLMNYYALGNKKILTPQYDPEFVFKIYDQNNAEQPITNYGYSMDLDSGYFYINAAATVTTNTEKPFSPAPKPNAYPDSSSVLTQSRYKMHIEYKYKFKTYQLPNFSIVKYSETLLMNGVKLIRDADYTIDYESGFIFFFNEDRITEKTVIDVTYEYMPFGGGFQSNLFGARAELKLDPLAIGSTYLYTGGQTPQDVPAAGATPSSLSLLDIDAKATISQSMMDSLFGRVFFLPTEISFSAEMAKSTFNPNIFKSNSGESGVAMLDGMESSDNIAGLGTDFTAWFASSIPSSTGFFNSSRASLLGLSSYDEYSHDPSVTTKRQMLKLDYNLPAGNWDAIRYVISSNGSDFSKYGYLEIWMNMDDWSKNVEFNVDIGEVSEDINANAILDTEDANGDGVLNAGEDTGITVPNIGGISQAGISNNRLDKEDLNNNGILDIGENCYRYTFNTGSIPLSYVAGTVVNSLGTWKLIKIPLLFDTTIAKSGVPNKSLVKHARVWFTSSTGAAGSIVLESLQFTGNKWERRDIADTTLDVKAINKLLDPSYLPLTNDFFIVNTTADLNREQSLSILYQNTNSSTSTVGMPYIYKNLAKPVSFIEYKNIRLDIYKKTAIAGDKFFLRIGSDESNYWEYLVEVDSLNTGWQAVTLPLNAPASKTGSSFFLGNVKIISMGVKSNGPNGELWLNNLRLADPDLREGMASRLGGSVKFGDFFSTAVDYKKIDSTFSFFEDASVNSSLSVAQTYASVKQNQMYYSVVSNLKIADFMPLNVTYRRDELTTSAADKANPNYISFPEKASDTYSSGLNFSLFNPLNINLNANYRTEDIQYLPNAVSTMDNTRSKTYNVSSRATYALPPKLLGLLPLGSNNFEAEFKYATDQIEHSADKSRNSDSTIRETFGKWSGGYEILSGLNINPFYQIREVERKGNVYAYNSSIGGTSIPFLNDFSPQTQGKGAGLSAVYSKLPGCSPRINYNAVVDRDYNAGQLRTGSSLDIGSDFRLFEWFDFFASAAPTLNINHRISANALYDKYGKGAAGDPLNNLSTLDIWGLVPADNYSFNSSQLITDTATGRFKIASITFNPRGSISYEGNRQAQFLTKTNMYSLGSGVNVDNPPIPLLGFLNPSNLDVQYDFKNIARRDARDIIISNSFSHSGYLIMPFKVSEAFNGSLTFNTILEDRLENNVTYMNRSFSPGIDIIQNLNFSDPIKLPDFIFGGAVIKIDQTVRINYKLNLILVRNTANTTAILSNINTDNYTAGAFVQYGFSKNIRADIGLQFNYFIDNVSSVNNYYAYGLNLKVSAVF
ncbi:MAG: hypothetical protein NTX32_02755 [Candidatus Firestonebacteria bacterium]|nr:hypothetical protein [Candidatus Firestonebacteria bacterium]